MPQYAAYFRRLNDPGAPIGFPVIARDNMDAQRVAWQELGRQHAGTPMSALKQLWTLLRIGPPQQLPGLVYIGSPVFPRKPGSP